ncbi:MAG: NAD(P)/FAD-dependent oxidoreductase [Elusimicrobiota bacterium]
MKELVIIGGGPAGLTGAIYACRQNIDFKIITRDVGGQAALSSQVENYTGFHMVTGEDLINKFEDHVKEFGVEIKEGANVTNIQKSSEGYKITTDDGECCETQSILIATGAKPRRLNVQGEKKFLNKGVAYCAVCDAPIFSGKDVAVIGGGNSALDAVRQLVDIAQKVYIVTDEKQLGGEEILREKLINNSSVKVITEGITKKITGDKMVENLVVEVNGKIKSLDVQGVFVEIGWIPASDFIDIVDKNSKGEIIVDINNKTSEKGIYAAGDVTSISKKQIIIAAGEGAKGALNAIDYISKE